MKFWFSICNIVCIAVVLITLIILAACAPEADNEIISPELGPRLVAIRAAGQVGPLPTPTPALLATMADEQIYAGLPQEIAEALPSADVANAPKITLVQGCQGCHTLEPGAISSGPSWVNVGDTAITRVAGQSPALYFYTSITEPNAHVVEGFAAGIMPPDFKQKLSTSDIATLIKFLLSQHRQ